MNELVSTVEREPLVSSRLTTRLKDIQVKLQFAVAGVAVTDDFEVEAPKKAPALWLERKNRYENPFDFVRREYKPWLGRGLSRATIKTLDESLYRALYRWTATGGAIPPDVVLPTQREVNDAELDRRGFISGELDDEAREVLRLNKLARTRRRRTSGIENKKIG